MRTSTTILVTCMACTLWAGSSLADSPLEVELSFTSEIQQGNPVSPGNSFEPGRVYCWNHVKGGEGQFKIFHVWYKDGRQVWKQSVRIKGKTWKTWSYHDVKPGSWKVEVVDQEGTVLESGEFIVHGS